MKRIISILLILISLIFLYYAFNYYQNRQNEISVHNCIESTLLNMGIKGIDIETLGRGSSPILTGTASKVLKTQIIKNINISCQVDEIQDFISLPIKQNNNPFISFNIDAFNHIITINGAFNNDNEFNDILESFNDAFPHMKIQHEVKIDAQVNATDFALDMTLLLASIDTIRVADITIKGNQLILNGIVRDAITEQSTLKTLHQLFDDKYNIVNNLLQVAESKVDTNKLEIQPLPMPELKLPDSNN